MADQKDVDESGSDKTRARGRTCRTRTRPGASSARPWSCKQQRRHATADAVVRDGSEKSHGAQGPTKGRTFRRKSV